LSTFILRELASRDTSQPEYRFTRLATFSASACGTPASV
jgi:hypothetical protein